MGEQKPDLWRKVDQYGCSEWRDMPVPAVCLGDELRGFYSIEYAVINPWDQQSAQQPPQQEGP